MRPAYYRAVIPKRGETIRAFATPAAFDAWLAVNHAKKRVLWLKMWKKASGKKSVTWNEAVDVALCWGWIDGQSQSLDEKSFLQRYTPRGPKSRWSKINRRRVARLVKAKRMRPPGAAEVARAKKDGRWRDAYDSPSTITAPPVLTRALAKEPEAKAFFATLDSRNRYAILSRLHHAKKPETKARLVETFVAMLKERRRLY